ncbi:MAG: 6-carboxytetrahydropterin synthase QueD [Planctomycetes bacterium]|nr:6-carboxytetrahydropterin synthase QueD [Planctomycetota bacterium]
MPYTLVRHYQIEAAHRLPKLPPEHKCHRLHGHSFKLEIVVKGELDPELGWVIDYGEMDRLFAPLFDRLDHRFLNEVPGLENPTSELLARWIYRELAGTMPGLAEVRVAETCQERCIYSE